MKSLTLEQVKKIKPAILLKLINRAKSYIKKSDAVKNVCKEYGVEPSVIDVVPVRFGDIDVSARTSHGIIILNYKLLCDGDFFKDYGYIIHEFVHYLQQTQGELPTQGADDGDYLHNKYEQEGFQHQIQYIDDVFGKERADNYIENILDHHNKSGKERKELKKVLKGLL